MNDLNVPTIDGEKICSCCLRRLPTKYFLKDTSRSDKLACNCNSCLFPNGSYYRAKFPELYEPDRFPKIPESEIPYKLRSKRIHHSEELTTVEAESEKAGKALMVN